MEEVFQFLFPEIQQVSSIVTQQQQAANTVMETVKGFVPKIQAAWTGDDATAFAQHIASHFVPDIMALIAAIAGINTNINKATDTVTQADSQISGLADQLGGVFDSII
jgi:WXG100 family type VII secretion target